MHVPIDDLDGIATNGVRVRHIMTSEIQTVRLEEDPADVLAWMEGLDFDVAPVEASTLAQVVLRDDLRAELVPLGQIARPIRPPHLVAADTPVRDALVHLAQHHWILVIDGTSVVGVVTSDDLRRPAVTMLFFAYLIAWDRALRRLVATYTSVPEPVEPGQWVPDLGRTLRRVRDCSGLRVELAMEDDATFEQDLEELVDLRNAIAHGKPSLLDTERSVNRIVGTFHRLVGHAERAWGLVRADRPQVWDAYLKTVITHEGEVWSGVGAVGILPGDGELWVITAANPMEQSLPADENARRNEALRRMLRRRVDEVVDVTGTDPAGAWQEPSFAIWGLSEDDVRRLAQKFGQRAVFRLTPTMHGVVTVAAATRRSRGRTLAG